MIDFHIWPSLVIRVNETYLCSRILVRIMLSLRSEERIVKGLPIAAGGVKFRP